MRTHAPFKVEDTHGVLGRKKNAATASSDDFRWTSIYASSQSEFPFEAYFSAVDDHLIVMHRSGPVTVDVLNGARTRRRVVPSGGLHLVPGGMSFGFRLMSQLDTLHCYIRRAVIEEVATDLVEGDPSKIDIVPDFIDRDIRMTNLMQAVMFALEDSDYATALYVDCLSRAAATQLVRNYSNARLRTAPPGLDSGASPVVRQAIAYMRDRLDESLTLEDIAAVVNRSPSHFARQFRNHVGVPPYQYLLNLRLEKAREMLEGTRLSIAEIAFECGFSHQEHLTRLFRRQFDTTPAAYRKSRQN